MKTRRLLCSIVFTGILAWVGCSEDGAPTEPTGVLDLTGAWAGTMTYYDSSGCAREHCDRPVATGDDSYGELFDELPGRVRGG